MEKEIVDIDNTEEEMVALGNRTAKMFTTIFIGKLLTFLIVGFSFIVVARILGPAEYGIYALAIAVPGLFSAFSDFGLGTSVVKFISEYLGRNEILNIIALIKKVFIILLVGAGILTLLSFVMSGFIADSIFHVPSYTFLFEVGSLTVILSVLFSVATSILISMNYNKYLAYTILLQVLTQAFSSISLALLEFGALAPLLGTITGLFTGFIAAFYLITANLRKQSKRIEMKQKKQKVKSWRELLKFSLPLGISGGIGNLVNNVAILTLGVYSTTVIVGNFSISNKVSTMFDLIIGSIGIASLSLFSFSSSKKSNIIKDPEAKKNTERYYKYSIFFTFLLMFPIILLVVLLAKPISYTVFSAAYTYAPLYIIVMALGVIIYIINSYSSSLIVSIGNVKSILKYSIIASIVELILIPLLIPAENGFGLSLILFIIIPAISCVLYVYQIRSKMGLKIPYMQIFKIFLISLLSIVFVIPLIIIFNNNYIPLIIASIIEQIILYPALIGYTKIIDNKIINYMKKMTKDIPLINIIADLLLKYIEIFVELH
ncbi:MAG: oligosaccharide flippase family protein [Candidatus Micrarchaeia archaeon]